MEMALNVDGQVRRMQADLGSVSEQVDALTGRNSTNTMDRYHHYGHFGVQIYYFISF